MTSTTDQAPKRPASGPPGRTVRDLTTGPIGSTLILFALPVMGSNILQSLNGSANAVWVSHAIGETALAAISNANNILFLMLGAVFGVSMSANLMIAQAVGAHDQALAKKVVGTSTAFFAVLSLSVGALGYWLTPMILDAMGTPGDARQEAIDYLRVIFLAMPFMYFFSFMMMAQRGTGDSRSPFWFSLFAVSMDITLNPILIMGIGPFPRLGVAGSAASTLISQTVTLALMIAILYRKRSVLVLRPSEWGLLKPDLAIVRSLVFKGLPMALQMLVVSGAAVVMISFVNRYGSHTAAAYGAAIQVWTYVQMPAMALGAAVSSMAAQNVGAGRMDRVDKVARVGSLYALACTAGPVVVIYALEPWIMRAFLPATSPSLPIALHINSFALWGFIPLGIAFVLFGVVRATGAVVAPLTIMFISMWLVRIPFTDLMQARLGSDAVWGSFPLGSAMSFALALAYYRWGGWRKARLMEATPRGQAPDLGQATPDMVEDAEVAGQEA